MGSSILFPAALLLPRSSGANCFHSLHLSALALGSALANQTPPEWREPPLRPAMQSQQPAAQQPAARAAVTLTRWTRAERRRSRTPPRDSLPAADQLHLLTEGIWGGDLSRTPASEGATSPEGATSLAMPGSSGDAPTLHLQSVGGASCPGRILANAPEMEPRRPWPLGTAGANAPERPPVPWAPWVGGSIPGLTDEAVRPIFWRVFRAGFRAGVRRALTGGATSDSVEPERAERGRLWCSVCLAHHELRPCEVEPEPVTSPETSSPISEQLRAISSPVSEHSSDNI